MKLVLIEGPGKRDSVQHYLGDGYKVMPTFGHCRDLPEKTLGVDIKNNFEPEYVVVPDHKKYVDDIVTVTDDEISSAILSLIENQKLIAEGAGAVSVAAVMFTLKVKETKGVNLDEIE